jgi:hypothetical protein
MQNKLQLIDEKELSRITRRALSTIRNDRHLGRGIPYIRIGRSIRYNLYDVQSYLESHRIKTRQI